MSGRGFRLAGDVLLGQCSRQLGQGVLLPVLVGNGAGDGLSLLVPPGAGERCRHLGQGFRQALVGGGAGEGLGLRGDGDERPKRIAYTANRDASELGRSSRERAATAGPTKPNPPRPNSRCMSSMRPRVPTSEPGQMTDDPESSTRPRTWPAAIQTAGSLPQEGTCSLDHSHHPQIHHASVESRSKQRSGSIPPDHEGQPVTRRAALDANQQKDDMTYITTHYSLTTLRIQTAPQPPVYMDNLRTALEPGARTFAISLATCSPS